MERTMRLPDRALGERASRRILEQGGWGVLSTCGRDGEPYGVPMSYVVLEKRLYLHGSNVGHKIENISQNPRVSFCVVGRTEVKPERIDCEYESVIVHGRARAVVGEEKRRAMEAFMKKYCGPLGAPGRKHLDRGIDKTFVLRVTVERMTGKAHRAAAVAAAAEHF